MESCVVGYFGMTKKPTINQSAILGFAIHIKHTNFVRDHAVINHI